MAQDKVCSWAMLSLAETDCETTRAPALKGGKLLADIIREQYPERVGKHSDLDTVVKFNDHPDTTFDDVERVFQKAEVAWDEQIGL